MALATMFITTQLTRWFAPMEYQIIDFDKSWATVGLKLACSWTCGMIYLIFLLLPDRCCCQAFMTKPEPDPQAAVAGASLMLHNSLLRRNNAALDGSRGFADGGSQDGTFMTAATLVDHDLVSPRSYTNIVTFTGPTNGTTTNGSSQNNFAHM